MTLTKKTIAMTVLITIATLGAIGTETQSAQAQCLPAVLAPFPYV